MALLFENHTFLVAPGTLASTVQVLERHGGTVVRSFSAHVTCGVAADAADSTVRRLPLEKQIPSARCFRALRLPVVYEAWVHACAAACTLLPCRNLCALEHHFATTVVNPTDVLDTVGQDEGAEPQQQPEDGEEEAMTMAHEEASQAARCRRALHETLEHVCGLSRATAATGLVAYDPLLLEGVTFTTTKLPLHIKANVVAALQFLGAHYSPDLTTKTLLVVYGGVHTTSSSSSSSSCASTTTQLTPSGCDHRDASFDATPSHSPRDASSSPAGTVRATHPPGAAVPVSKLAVARALNMVCVVPSWVHQCLRDGAFPPLSEAAPAMPRVVCVEAARAGSCARRASEVSAHSDESDGVGSSGAAFHAQRKRLRAEYE